MLNKHTFAYQAGLLASSNMLLLLLNFVYRILLGRLAGPEGLGVHALTMQVYSIVMSICVAGMTVAVTNMSASLYQSGDIRNIRRMIRFALICFLVLLLLASVPILLLRDTIAVQILNDQRTAMALPIILLCIGLTGVENIFKALFNGIRKVKYTAISEVGEQTLRIVLVIVVLAKLMTGDHGYTAFLIIVCMTLSELYSVLFLAINYYRKIMRAPAQKKQNGNTLAKQFLRISVPAAGTSILANVFSSIATIIFPRRLQLANYTHAEALSALGLLSGMVTPVLLLPSALVNALCTLLMPNISASVARGDQQDLQRKIDKGIETAGLLGMPTTAMLLPFVPLICTLLFGQTAPVALVSLVAVEVLVTYYLILSISILNGLGLQRQVLLFAGGAEIIQLALVWILSANPRLHVYGYLIGMITGDLLRVFLGFYYIQRVAQTRIKFFSAFLVPFACATAMYCAVRICFFYLMAWGATMLMAMLMSFFICALLLLLLLRLLGVHVIGYLKRVVVRV